MKPEDLIGTPIDGAPKPDGIRIIRVRKLDGKPQIGTSDYRTDRLNVEVENGKITKIRGVG